MPSPQVCVEPFLFQDSCLITVSTDFEGARLLMEYRNGNSIFYRECEGKMTIKETSTLRFKASHPDYEDSKIKVVKVYKKSEKKLDILGVNDLLVDDKRAPLDKNSEEWLRFNSEKVKFQFQAPKHIEEIEILSLVDKENKILPPKKISLFAHLKNGDKVHIRTTNTIGNFSLEKDYYSHALRLIGKPKLKKVLRKTEYFSLELIPHKKEDVLFELYFDEIIIR